MKQFWAVVFLLLAASTCSASPGVVVSVSPPATRIGEAILARGGNAVDAAVAVGFALAVTWPEAGNIGGGGFMLVRPAGAKSVPVMIDYRETAPASATKDLFVKNRRTAHLTVGVPGSVAGLFLAQKKYGKLPWKDLVLARRHAGRGRLRHRRGAGRLDQSRRRPGQGIPRTASRLWQARGQGPLAGR